MTENQPITTNNTTNKKLTNCKVCGAVMAKSAKKCQSCGAKNPRKAIKKLITFLIILAIIIGYTSIFTIKNNALKIIANNGEMLNLSKFQDTFEEYALNDDYDEFVDNYLPAQVSLSGKITEIDTSNVGVSTNGNSVHLESDATNLITFEIDNKHRYYISYELWTDKENYEFGKLKVGDKVTVTGTITKSITLTDNNYIVDRISSSLEIIGTEDGITKK